MSETKAAFAERRIHLFENLSQFVTTLTSRKTCSKGLIPKNVKKSNFLSLLCSKKLREYKNPKFRIGDRVRISKYDLQFSKGYKQEFTQEVVEIIAISSRESPIYLIKDEQDEIIRGNFYQRELIKVL